MVIRSLFVALGIGVPFEPLTLGAAAGITKPGAVFVPLTPRRFEIENQVLHVQPQLAERVLHEGQNPATATRAIDHAGENRFDPAAVGGRQSADELGQFDDIGRQFVGFFSGLTRGGGH